MELAIELDDEDMLVTVEEIDEETVTVDANHELAGLDLHFAGKVIDIRDATPEELEHGHAHFDDEPCEGPEGFEGYDDEEEDEEE